MALFTDPFLSSLLVSAVFSIISLIVGIVAGWWVFAPDKASQGDAARDTDRAMMAIGRIHDLTNRVAQDVDVHSNEVERISAELESLRECDPALAGSSTSDTIAKMLSANERLRAQLTAAEEKLKEQAGEIASHQSAARTDFLTTLPNRRAFDQEVARRYAEWQRKDTPFTLMLVDVDQFKQFNDTHGHQAGDEVLRQIGRGLASGMREMDLACRYGGEEFVAIMPATPLNDAAQVAERARRAIESLRIDWQGQPLSVTACFGLAQILPGEDTTGILRRADEALYASKQAGRNCGYWHDGHQCLPLSSGPVAPAAPLSDEPRRPVLQLLSKLPQREQADQELNRRISECERYGFPLSLMYVQLHELEQLAAEHGEDTCQLVLDVIAQRLRATVREMDYVARDADDRFAVILPGSSAPEAAQVAKRVQTTQSSQTVQIGGTTVVVSLSVGLACHRPEEDADSLRSRVDAALQQGCFASSHAVEPLAV